MRKKFKQRVLTGLGVLLLAVTALSSSAQQDPMYTQYMFNTQSINPAYAGSWNTIGFMALTRQQWTGFDEAPETYSFSLQAPLKNEKIGLGLNVINDKLGIEKRFYVFSDYSYLAKITKKTSLRLGLKAGFTNYSNDLNSYRLPSNDPDGSFQGHVKKTMFNLGAGIFLHNDRYFVSLSVPKFIKNEFQNDYENFSVQSEIQHYYLMTGFVFELTENLIFKPTTLAKATFNSETGAPAEIDLTANFLIKERVWLGAMYRTGDSYGFLAQWIFKGNLRLGYSHDIATTAINSVSSGTHEVMVSYEIASKKTNLASRYF